MTEVKPGRRADAGGTDLTKVPFREIAETVVGVDNMSLPMRTARLFIRYLVRGLGLRRASTILSAVTLPKRRAAETPSRRSVTSQVRYLLAINKLRIDYLDRLCDNDLPGSVRAKIKWAEGVLDGSHSLRSRWDAKGYLGLLSRHGCYDGERWGECHLPAGSTTDRSFYIYGPNAESKPSTDYAGYTLVLTKPIDVNVAAFSDSILFVNSMYFAKMSREAPLRDGLIAKYGQIFVGCRHAEVSKPFVRAKFQVGDHIGSSMALGRVLYNLIRTYGSFRCVIEGFDLYLGATAYGAYYPHLARNSDTTISERVICKALADHDALYNFLYVKEMVERVELVDSPVLRGIVQMSAEQYLERLGRVRNFASLR